MSSKCKKWSKSKRELMDLCDTTLSITVANNLSTDKTVILSHFCFKGMLSVVMISSNAEFS